MGKQAILGVPIVEVAEVADRFCAALTSEQLRVLLVQIDETQFDLRTSRRFVWSAVTPWETKTERIIRCLGILADAAKRALVERGEGGLRRE